MLGTESFIDRTFKNSELFPCGYAAIINDRDCNGGIAYREELNPDRERSKSEPNCEYRKFLCKLAN